MKMFDEKLNCLSLPTTVKLNGIEYYTIDVFVVGVELWELTKFSDFLGCNINTLSRNFNKLSWLPKSRQPIGAKLLRVLDLKKCSRCHSILEYANFYKDSQRFDGLQPQCQKCQDVRNVEYYQKNKFYFSEYSKEYRNSNKELIRYYSASRRALKIKATPSWANTEAIKEIYANCPEGYHVDHIIPLKSNIVCGLHVENNLQYLPAEKNLKKSNKFYISSKNTS